MKTAVRIGRVFPTIPLLLVGAVSLSAAARSPAGGGAGKDVYVARKVKFENPKGTGRPRIVWVKRTWEEGRWNGRGELIRFKGKWYCTFKEGLQHTNEHVKELDKVGIRIIASEDTDTWQSVTKIQHKEVLFENATLLVTPDGRLMCVICQDTPRGVDRAEFSKKYVGLTNWVAFSKDGRTWTSPQQLRYFDSDGRPRKGHGEIFHMAWHEGKAYCMPRKAGLYVSTDGVKYKRLPPKSTTPPRIPFGGNENALRITPDGEIIVLCRSNSPPAAIATSKPPYTHWDVHLIPHAAQGPNFIILPDGRMWAACRGPDVIGGEPGSHTVLYRMGRKTYEPMLTLPSGGDTSYAGIVWHDEHLWVSYYSTHESVKGLRKARMYLAKIKLPPPPKSATAPARAAQEPKLLETECLWSRDSHSGFTDLIRFRDRWFCAFREGDHTSRTYRGRKEVDWKDGKVRVLTSADGAKWEPAAVIEEQGADLTDPKLSITPDGRLMLLAEGLTFEPPPPGAKTKKLSSVHPRVAFSKDGKTWTDLRKISGVELRHPRGISRPWRVTWHEGKAHAMDRGLARYFPGRLLTSADGVSYRVLSTYKQWKSDPPINGFGEYETTIRFGPDGEMIALSPAETRRYTRICTARPPYTSWKVDVVNPALRLRGANLIVLPSGEKWVAAGDHYAEKTILYRVVRRNYEPKVTDKARLTLEAALTLPSGGDTGYAGMAFHDGLLWVSYHSAHERKPPGKWASVYLAKIRLPQSGQTLSGERP